MMMIMQSTLAANNNSNTGAHSMQLQAFEQKLWGEAE
jgi:hypothetical protein